MKINKNKLISAIQHLLQKDVLETQEDIRVALQKQGFVVNQAMISRVLHKLGAIKMTENDRIVYRLPTELVAMSPKHSLSQLVLGIYHNEFLIIIQTTPGSAQLVARLLDQQKKIGILGTIAGDDTIFIAPEKTSKITEIKQKISYLLLGHEPK